VSHTAAQWATCCSTTDIFFFSPSIAADDLNIPTAHLGNNAAAKELLTITGNVQRCVNQTTAPQKGQTHGPA
jgi:hypothetical protein